MERGGDDEEVFDGRIRFHPDRLAARQVPDNERGEEVAEVVLLDPVGVKVVHGLGMTSTPVRRLSFRATDTGTLLSTDAK